MKYTDTELLNMILPMLTFYTKPYRDNPDLVEFQIIKGPICCSKKEFITDIQDRINKLAKMANARIINANADDSSSSEICEDISVNYGNCEEQTYSSEEYYDLKTECIKKDHEINRLRKTVEALEYLIYNCIPKDDRRKD